MRWDDPNAPVAMPATLTPQDAVNRGLPKPSQCDVVVVILWAWMGTPLPDTYGKPDGTPYLSGTEWEYEDALAGQPQPHVLVYRRSTKVNIDPDDPAVDQLLEQHRRVKQFFQRFQNPDGSLKGGYAPYDSPQAFRDRLRTDLLSFIRRRLDEAKPDARLTKGKAPPPYGDICKALRTGKVIPIIGAGVTRSSRPAEVKWDPLAPAFLPSGGELARFLAGDTDFPSDADRDDLAKVASFYEAFETRATLRDRLRQIEPRRVSRRQVCLSVTRPLWSPQAERSRRLPPRRAGCCRSARGAGGC